MISVPNLRLPLNGNNALVRSLIFIIVLTVVSSCIPRGQVVSPDAGQTDPAETEEVIEEVVEAAPVREVHQVALLLPFQLNRSNSTPSSTDLQRAELALDFYQGFKLGLERQTARGTDFKLDVIDSRDNENEVRRLATTAGVQEAALIVGPVFPKEIQAFADAAGLKTSDVLQVSPLAATMPTEFNLPNLVSITSPIITHVRALARQIVDTYKSGDVVLLYVTDEPASQQFLEPLRASILQLNRNIALHEVRDEERLMELARFQGNNLVVSGSNNRFQIVTMLDQLGKLRNQSGHRIQLFGHPNWAKMSFTADDALESFQTMISSTYYVDNRQTAVRDFNTWYGEEFGIEPSEFAYKGYDAGMYFGNLLARYGRDYRKHLLDTEYDGLHNSFDFEYNSQWGYVNQAVHFLRYSNGRFVR